MSPISLALNLLLAGLLTVTLMFGWRLSRQLKALKDSHSGFTAAVGDLDRAAQRAEQGLHELRLTTDQAVDLLAGRIDKARDVAQELEGLTNRAEAAAEKARVRSAAHVRQLFDKPRSAAPVQPSRAGLRETSQAEAEAAAEALILRLSEREILTSDAPTSRDADPLTLARGIIRESAPQDRPARGERRFDTLFQTRREPDAREQTSRGRLREVRPVPEDLDLPEPPRETRVSPRSRAPIDDDLFDPPPRGGRLRAYDGGRA